MAYNVQHLVTWACITSKQELVMLYYGYIMLEKAEPSSGQITDLFLTVYVQVSKSPAWLIKS